MFYHVTLSHRNKSHGFAPPHVCRALSVISCVPLQSCNRVRSTVVSGISVIRRSLGRRHPHRPWDFFPWPHCGEVWNVDKYCLRRTLYLTSIMSLLSVRHLTQKGFETAVSRTAFSCSEVIWIILQCRCTKKFNFVSWCANSVGIFLFHQILRRTKLIVGLSAAEMYQHKYNSPIYCCWRKQEFLSFFLVLPCAICSVPFSHVLSRSKRKSYI